MCVLSAVLYVQNLLHDSREFCVKCAVKFLCEHEMSGGHALKNRSGWKEEGSK